VTILPVFYPEGPESTLMFGVVEVPNALLLLSESV
jgi:hypothetical protein